MKWLKRKLMAWLEIVPESEIKDHIKDNTYWTKYTGDTAINNAVDHTISKRVAQIADIHIKGKVDTEQFVDDIVTRLKAKQLN